MESSLAYSTTRPALAYAVTMDDAGPDDCVPLPVACAGKPTGARVSTLGCDFAVTGDGLSGTCNSP